MDEEVQIMGDLGDTTNKITEEIQRCVRVLQDYDFGGVLSEGNIKEAAKNKIKEKRLRDLEQVTAIVGAAGTLEAFKSGSDEVRKIAKAVLPEGMSHRLLDDANQFNEIKQTLQESVRAAIEQAKSVGGSTSPRRLSSPSEGRSR